MVLSMSHINHKTFNESLVIFFIFYRVLSIILRVIYSSSMISSSIKWSLLRLSLLQITLGYLHVLLGLLMDSCNMIGSLLSSFSHTASRNCFLLCDVTCSELSLSTFHNLPHLSTTAAAKLFNDGAIWIVLAHIWICPFYGIVRQYSSLDHCLG